MKRFYIRTSLLFVTMLLLCNFLKAQSYEVKDAGIKEVNGIYSVAGTIKGKTYYMKDVYILFYKEYNSEWIIKSPKGILYRNKTNSETPPENGWKKTLGEGGKNPAPTVIQVNETPKNYLKH